MKDINFFTIQGWMVNHLKLSGNNLMIYAIIYGFSQDGESEFNGSINYLCNCTNTSRPTVSKALKYLTEKACIIKRKKIINNVTFNRYKINLLVVKNLYRGSKESLRGGSKESLHNIDINKKKKDNKERKINKKKKDFIIIDQFETFWKLYPRKKGKSIALKSWNTICKLKLSERPNIKTIKKALKLQIASEQWQDMQYIPHPSTWLNQHRWEDEIDKPSKRKGKVPTNGSRTHSDTKTNYSKVKSTKHN